MKTKTIEFIQFMNVTQAFDARAEISVEDFNKLESGKMSLETIIEKYDNIDYFNGEIIAEGDIESFEYGGEV